MLLFRPVGLEELRLVYAAEMRAFPPRLPDQPIFYPVTNEGYAIQIARDWNTKSGTKAGFVTQFAIDSAYAAKFERRVVGAREHEELWVPAEELSEFNARIEGRIQVTHAFFGDDYREGGREQFVALAKADLSATALDHAAVFVSFFFWEQADFASDGISGSARDALLSKLRSAWNHDAHGASLGVTTTTATSSG